MRINFNDLERKELKNFNGGEGALLAEMHVDDKQKILRGCLKKGSSIGAHCHETSSETLYVLSGEGIAVCDGKAEKLSAGDCHYCPKGSTHTLRNDKEEDLIFFAVVPLL